jgi:hypothetical protein
MIMATVFSPIREFHWTLCRCSVNFSVPFLQKSNRCSDVASTWPLTFSDFRCTPVLPCLLILTTMLFPTWRKLWGIVSLALQMKGAQAKFYCNHDIYSQYQWTSWKYTEIFDIRSETQWTPGEYNGSHWIWQKRSVKFKCTSTCYSLRYSEFQ